MLELVHMHVPDKALLNGQGLPWSSLTPYIVITSRLLIRSNIWSPRVSIYIIHVTTLTVLWCPYLWKGTLIRFSKCTYFKEAYFHNAMRNLNQTRVFYGGGVAAAMMPKWSLSTAPSGCYGAEFTVFVIEVSFSKNGTTTKVRIFGMEGALDF